MCRAGAAAAFDTHAWFAASPDRRTNVEPDRFVLGCRLAGQALEFERSLHVRGAWWVRWRKSKQPFGGAAGSHPEQGGEGGAQGARNGPAAP